MKKSTKIGVILSGLVGLGTGLAALAGFKLDRVPEDVDDEKDSEEQTEEKEDSKTDDAEDKKADSDEETDPNEADDTEEK